MGAVVAAAERTWPMAGCAEELGFVRTALRSRGGVVLAGAAGVGKTRLAREAVAAARGPARWVGATTAARAVPLGAFTPLLGRPATLRHGFDEVRHDPRPLVVDDAHLLDDVSATLLHQLVLSCAAPIPVTLRSGEPVPDAVRALRKDEQLPRLEVQALPERETAALVEAAPGAAVDGECRRRLRSLSRGNVLFLRRLVDGACTERLRLVHDVWRWEGDTTVGPGFAEIVDARLGRLGDAERHTPDVVALGEPIGVALLETLVDGTRVEARLAHPLYGEVLRSRISTLRARRLRGRLAEAIAATGARRAGDDAQRAETVALAAAGLSDRDIAARLVVSVRTVEGHLYRAFAKLGVAERGELGAT